jgi:hypothetical protein
MGEETTRVFMEAGMPFSETGRISILKQKNEYLASLKSKRISMRPRVASVQEDGQTLKLSDGSTVENVDVVLFCTGYRMNFSFLPKDLSPLMNDGFRGYDYCGLYNYCVHPKISNLFFAGYFDTFGNQIVTGELMCRYIASVIAGNTQLPSEEERVKWVEQRRMKDMKREGFSPMFRANVPFMTLFAKELGIMPKKVPQDQPMVSKTFCSKL